MKKQNRSSGDAFLVLKKSKITAEEKINTGGVVSGKKRRNMNSADLRTGNGH